MFPQGRPLPVIDLELGVGGGGGCGSYSMCVGGCVLCVCMYVWCGVGWGRSFRGKGTRVNPVWKGSNMPGWLSCLANVHTALVTGRQCTHLDVALILAPAYTVWMRWCSVSFSEPLYP